MMHGACCMLHAFGGGGGVERCARGVRIVGGVRDDGVAIRGAVVALVDVHERVFEGAVFDREDT